MKRPKLLHTNCIIQIVGGKLLTVHPKEWRVFPGCLHPTRHRYSLKGVQGASVPHYNSRERIPTLSGPQMSGKKMGKSAPLQTSSWVGHSGYYWKIGLIHGVFLGGHSGDSARGSVGAPDLDCLPSCLRLQNTPKCRQTRQKGALISVVCSIELYILFQSHFVLITRT